MAKALKKKTASKKAPVKKAKKKVSTPRVEKETQGGFMWKLLKKKEAERALRNEQNKNLQNQGPGNHHGQVPTRHEGFSRFAGPRRRAA